MALQAASLVSSAFSVRKDVFYYLFLCFSNRFLFVYDLSRRLIRMFWLQGKLNASASSSFKESSLFGVSLSEQSKADFVSSSLRCKVPNTIFYEYFLGK